MARNRRQRELYGPIAVVVGSSLSAPSAARRSSALDVTRSALTSAGT